SCAGLPYSWELQLAPRLAAHPEEAVRAWAEPRERHRQELLMQRDAEPAPPEPAPFKVGLCDQLRRQPDPAEPNLETCLALLASRAPCPDTAPRFKRLGWGAPKSFQRPDEKMTPLRALEGALPLLGHAWLYRWDQHALAFASRCTALGEDLPSGMRFL